MRNGYALGVVSFVIKKKKKKKKTSLLITLTSPCREHPLNTLYLGKSGSAEVYTFFLNFAENLDCGCLLEPPH